MSTPLPDDSTARRGLRQRLHHQLRRLTLWPLAVVLVLTLALLGVTAYLLNCAKRVDDTYETLAELSHVETLALERESCLRGFRLTADPAFLGPFERAGAALPAELDALEAMVRNNPSRHRELQRLREALRAWNVFASDVLATGMPTDHTRQVARGKTLMDDVHAQIDRIKAQEHASLDAWLRTLAPVRTFTLPAILAAGMLFAPLLILTVRRTLTHLDLSYRTAWDEADRQRERLDVTLSSIGDAVVATDTAGAVTYLNPVAVALTGWPAEEACGQPIDRVVNLVHEQTRSAVASPVALALREGNAVGLANHALLIATDGREIPIADSAAPIRDPDGRITGVVMVFRDQTRERAANAALAEKARLLDLTSDAILIRDVAGLIVYWNRGAEKMYGWSREEALGQHSHELLKTECPQPFEEITDELYRTDHWTGEFVHTTRDGRRITVLARKALDRDSEGKPAGILQTLTDITERKRDEEARSRIAAIIDSSNDAIIGTDLNGVITSWNSAAERLFGYSAQEAIGQPVTRLIPADRADEEPHILARIRKDERIERRETIRRRKDGTLCDVSLTVSPIKDGEGRIVGASKIVRDISERKRAEEALRESEERFRTMANSMAQLAWTARGDGYIEWYNQRWYEYTGTTPEQMEGWGWQRVHDAEELPRVLECWKAAIATGDSFEMTFPLRGADGVFRPFLTRGIPLRNAAGQVVQWFGTNTDIDEIKRAEEAVRAAAERFRFLAESMPQKIFTTAPNGEFTYFNRQWFEYTGLSSEQMRGQTWLDFVHPDDQEETIRRWQHSLETGEYFELQHRCRHHDGAYRWNMSRARAMRDLQGGTTMWIGSSTDIDDLMRTQEQLVSAQAQLADRAVQLEAMVEKRTSELNAANRQLLAEADERERLEAEIANAVEVERARLGQELHDGLAQELAGIAMLLHVLEQQLMKPAPASAAEAARLRGMVENAQGSARNLAKNFYPVELEKDGLLAALRNFALRTQERFGVLCVVEADHGGPVRLKDATAVQLFRIAQEAVHNAAKHAEANEIHVTLGKRDGVWLLTVKDNGVGLPGEAQCSGGMGLRIMQYRARMIGGTVDVGNDQDCGVRVSCAVPATKNRRQAG